MKVLEVFGDDYGAVLYEDAVEANEVDPKELWDKAKENGQQVYQEGDTYFEYLAHEFGEVDPKFITWIQGEIMDYDTSKSQNFYIID